MQDVIVKLRGGNPYESKRTLSSRLTRNLAAALPLSFLSVNATATKDTTSQTEEALLPHIRDANAAVTLLLHEDDRGLSKQPIVVIDEFDLMSTVERSHFADLLKQLGDQRVPIKFIFCGIGDTVDDLLEAHGSANRYFDGVKIERLNVSSRWDIIDKSATALGLSVDDEVRHRIAAISDGFPVYIHRICEKLYQTVFYDEEIVDVVGISHLDTAIVETIIAIEHFIRKPYDATLLRTDGETLELVLWALADHSDLTRTQRSIFDSYSKILERLSLPPVQEKEFTPLLAKLRSGHEPIVRLYKGRRGVNEFCENVFRGYVRLRAEAKGIQLALDYASAPDPRRESTVRVSQGINPLYERPSFGRRSK
ncbi:hypothetical protein PCO31010_00193 [Pandoraea commovens]|uniref:Uncharacterized protein n=2 Tax=Pandoraea commovens TaxID=2508289 RepID=A0A5E4RIP4_9BURK|nr:hypothetical protein PCO31010_00193 [Pandoraea commovens]